MSRTKHRKPQLPRAPVPKPGQFHGDGRRPRIEPTVEEGLAEYEEQLEDSPDSEWPDDSVADSGIDDYGYWDNSCSCFRSWEEDDYWDEP